MPVGVRAGIVAAIFRLKNLALFASETVSNESRNFSGLTRAQFTVFVSVCLFAASIPFLNGEQAAIKTAPTNAAFPTEFENKPLQELELTERERVFMQDFPGETRRFTDGRREIIIRHITEATRKLHPSADCLAAIGYAIKPLPLKIDEQNQKWACFTADREKESLRVCERIYTDSGENWTDVSSWYWSAIGGGNKDYWAITVAETNE